MDSLEIRVVWVMKHPALMIMYIENRLMFLNLT